MTIKDDLEKVYCSHCEVPSYYPSIKIPETHEEAVKICYQQGTCAQCTSAISEILKTLRDQQKSWHPNSGDLRKFINSIPNPKGRLVFIPDSNEEK